MIEYDQLFSVSFSSTSTQAVQASTFRSQISRSTRKALRLAAIGEQFASLAEEAGQRNYSHQHYLKALLQTEVEAGV